jgi:hypothetical protein
MAFAKIGLLLCAFCLAAEGATDPTGKCGATKLDAAGVLGATKAYACTATTVLKNPAPNAACTTVAECNKNCCETGDPAGKCAASKINTAGVLGASVAYSCPAYTVSKSPVPNLACKTAAECNTNCCETGDPAGKCGASMINAAGVLGARKAYPCSATTVLKTPAPAKSCKTVAECTTNCCEAGDPAGTCTASKMNNAGVLGTQAKYVCAGHTTFKAGATGACKTVSSCNKNCCVVTDATGNCAASKVTSAGTLSSAKAKYTCPTGVTAKAGVGAAQTCKTPDDCNVNCCVVDATGTCQTTKMKNDGTLQTAAAAYGCPAGFNAKANPKGACTAKPVCDANCCTNPAVTTTPAAVVTTTPAAAVTTTPAVPVRLQSEHGIAFDNSAGSNMLWLGVGAVLGMAVIMVAKSLRSFRNQSRSLEPDSEEMCRLTGA